MLRQVTFKLANLWVRSGALVLDCKCDLVFSDGDSEVRAHDECELGQAR